MGLFSFFRKNQQESSVGRSDFYSQADEEKPAARKRRQGTKRDEPVDPVLPEKKRARRRLVGAVALVLAAIIGLPMILDSEPKPLPDDIDIRIPSRDNSAPVTQGKPPAQKKVEQAAADTLTPDEEIIEPAISTAAPEGKPEATIRQATPHVTEAKPNAQPPKAASIEPKPAATSPTKKADDATRARAILDGKLAAPDSVHAKPSGKVALQIAALASQDKVNELQKKLQSAGLKSYTQKVATESGERIRVRIGPFANDAEAEKARAKLAKLGLTGKLIPA